MANFGRVFAFPNFKGTVLPKLFPVQHPHLAAHHVVKFH